MQYDKQSTRVDAEHNIIRGVSNGRFYKTACAVCGDIFKCCMPPPISKYCSARCANDAYIAQRRERMEQKRAAATQCVACGIPIQQAGAKISLYCSNRCKQKAYRERAAQKNTNQ